MKNLLIDILIEAQKVRASKIHIEPGPKDSIVRFRIDGVLHEFFNISLDSHALISGTVVELADLDSQEKALFQDGYFELNRPDLQGTFIVSFFPGLAGNRICITPYRQCTMEFNLDKLGLEDNSLEIWRDAMHSQKPGLITVTGPTNSGKCTTIYSALMEMQKRNFTVATAEWERRGILPGVHQVAVDEGRGLTFAAICREYFNSDIDVIFLGELTDYETAETAFRAVLGKNKLVFTAMHCHSAISTVARLQNMGVEPWIIAEGLVIVQGQRLLRCLCQHCKEEAQVSDKILVNAGMASSLATNSRVYRAKGCSECDNRGYSGMILAAETFRMTETFTQKMLDGEGIEGLKFLAIEEGMKTLRQSALDKMRDGLTSLDEVLLRTPSD